jgi:hypothetical protein
MHKITYVSLAILMALVLLGFLFLSTNSKAAIVNSERFFVENQEKQSLSVADVSSAQPDNASNGLGDYRPSDPTGNEVFNPVDGGEAPVPASACFPRDRLSAEDLLPKDAANSRWAQSAGGSSGSLDNVNLLSAGYWIGRDTVSNTLRNPNLQLRSEPPNPVIQNLTPFNIPSIGPSDVGNRKALEIGSTGDW